MKDFSVSEEGLEMRQLNLPPWTGSAQLCAMVILVDSLHLPKHWPAAEEFDQPPRRWQKKKKKDTRGNGDSQQQTRDKDSGQLAALPSMLWLRKPPQTTTGNTVSWNREDKERGMYESSKINDGKIEKIHKTKFSLSQNHY